MTTLNPSALPAPWKSLALTASHEAQSPSGAANGETTPPHVQTPTRETTNNANLSFSTASQEAFLPAPWEGIAVDSTPATAARKVVNDNEPPCKKPCHFKGQETLTAGTTPSIGDAFPLTLGISVPFGLPSTPVDPNFLLMQEPTVPSQTRATSAEAQQETPLEDSTPLPLQVPNPASPKSKDTCAAAPQGMPSMDSAPLPTQDPTSPSHIEETSVATSQDIKSGQSLQTKHCRSSGTCKNRHDEPRVKETFDPFTRRRCQSQTSKSAPPPLPPVPTTAPIEEDMDSDNEYSSPSEETVTVTSSGNLPSRNRVAVATILNPPFEGSLN